MGMLALPESSESPGRRLPRMKSRTSILVSSRSSDPDLPAVVPVAWPEISLSVDAFSTSLRMHSCTIHYLKPDASDDEALHSPKLEDCLGRNDMQRCISYVQSSVNSLLRDPDEELPS